MECTTTTTRVVRVAILTLIATAGASAFRLSTTHHPFHRNFGWSQMAHQSLFTHPILNPLTAPFPGSAAHSLNFPWMRARTPELKPSCTDRQSFSPESNIPPSPGLTKSATDRFHLGTSRNEFQKHMELDNSKDNLKAPQPVPEVVTDEDIEAAVAREIVAESVHVPGERAEWATPETQGKGRVDVVGPPRRVVLRELPTQAIRMQNPTAEDNHD